MENQQNPHNECEREKELGKEIIEEKQEIEQIEKILEKEEKELKELEHELEESKKHHEPITVEVNNHPVTFTKPKATGSEIKATAIDQKIAIQQDFNLFEKTGSNFKPIADSEEVNLHCDQKFRAVAPDDNSMI